MTITSKMNEGENKNVIVFKTTTDEKKKARNEKINSLAKDLGIEGLKNPLENYISEVVEDIEKTEQSEVQTSFLEVGEHVKSEVKEEFQIIEPVELDITKFLDSEQINNFLTSRASIDKINQNGSQMKLDLGVHDHFDRTIFEGHKYETADKPTPKDCLDISFNFSGYSQYSYMTVKGEIYKSDLVELNRYFNTQESYAKLSSEQKKALAFCTLIVQKENNKVREKNLIDKTKIIPLFSTDKLKVIINAWFQLWEGFYLSVPKVALSNAIIEFVGLNYNNLELVYNALVAFDKISRELDLSEKVQNKIKLGFFCSYHKFVFHSFGISQSFKLTVDEFDKFNEILQSQNEHEVTDEISLVADFLELWKAGNWKDFKEIATNTLNLDVLINEVEYGYYVFYSDYFRDNFEHLAKANMKKLYDLYDAVEQPF